MQLLASFTRALNTSDQEAVLLGDLPSRFPEVEGAKRSCGGQVRLTGKMTAPGLVLHASTHTSIITF